LQPSWIRVRAPGGEKYASVKQTISRFGLNTVCAEARCPNSGECWNRGTATIMLLGDTCTRACRFCSVKSGHPAGEIDRGEPEKVAAAVKQLGLKYAVLTMVTRDDLPDGGAEHLAETVRLIRASLPSVLIETLVSDFGGNRESVKTLVESARPDVYAHNVEVVPRLSRAFRDARCSWERSLQSLRWAARAGARVTKSSLMVGCGESEQEVQEAMEALRASGVALLTIGQYLRPTTKQAPVVRFVPPAEFVRYRDAGLRLGFSDVASGPLVRSSFRAAESFTCAAGKLSVGDFADGLHAAGEITGRVSVDGMVTTSEYER
jgi:lipoic acid synthetase